MNHSKEDPKNSQKGRLNPRFFLISRPSGQQVVGIPPLRGLGSHGKRSGD